MFDRSRFNLAYWFALSMGSILFVFAGIVYYSEVKDRLESFDENLYKKTKSIANKSDYYLSNGRWSIDCKYYSRLANNELTYLNWYDRRGKLLKSIGIANEQTYIFPKIKKRFETIKLNGETPAKFRQVTVPIFKDNIFLGYLQVGTSLQPLESSLEKTLIFLSLGVPVALVLIAFNGWVLAGIAMKPIKESYEQLQRFTADASHELRSPLAAIVSNSQVALMPSLQNSPQQRTCIEEIEKAAKAMSNLISNLLFLARTQRQLTSAGKEKIDVVIILRSLVNKYLGQAKLLNRNLEINLPERSIYLKGNSELLQLALSNLIDNAFKYTSSGGKIEINLSIQSRRATIEITDDGIGIPETDLPHIFERFYRVDTARSRETGGFGLGLSIVEQIISVHGGKISVNSKIGEGTTFKLEFPIFES